MSVKPLDVRPWHLLFALPAALSGCGDGSSRPGSSRGSADGSGVCESERDCGRFERCYDGYCESPCAVPGANEHEGLRPRCAPPGTYGYECYDDSDCDFSEVCWDRDCQPRPGRLEPICPGEVPFSPAAIPAIEGHRVLGLAYRDGIVAASLEPDSGADEPKTLIHDVAAQTSTITSLADVAAPAHPVLVDLDEDGDLEVVAYDQPTQQWVVVGHQFASPAVRPAPSLSWIDVAEVEAGSFPRLFGTVGATVDTFTGLQLDDLVTPAATFDLASSGVPEIESIATVPSIEGEPSTDVLIFGAGEFWRLSLATTELTTLDTDLLPTQFAFDTAVQSTTQVIASLTALDDTKFDLQVLSAEDAQVFTSRSVTLGTGFVEVPSWIGLARLTDPEQLDLVLIADDRLRIARLGLDPESCWSPASVPAVLAAVDRRGPDQLDSMAFSDGRAVWVVHP